MNHTMHQSYELGYTKFSTMFVSTPSAESDKVGQLLGVLSSGKPKPGLHFFNKGNDFSLARSKFSSLSEAEQRDLILGYCTTNHEMRHIRQLADNSFMAFILLNRLKCISATRAMLISAKEVGLNEIKLPVIAYPEQFKLGGERLDDDIDFNNIVTMLNLLNVLSGYDVISIDNMGDLSDNIRKMLGWERCYVLKSTNELLNFSSPFGLNLTHLLEGQCRLEDTIAATSLMHLAGASKEFTRKIIKELWSTEGYYEAYNFFTANVNKVLPDMASIFNTLVFISLNPIIPGFNVPAKKEIIWQNTQPICRFIRCVDWVKTNGWPFDSGKSDIAVAQICSALNFEQISSIGRELENLELTMGDSIEGVIEKDIIKRHKIFCNAYQENRYFVSSLVADSEKTEIQSILNRMLPWFRTSGNNNDDVDIQYYPDGVTDGEMFLASAAVNTVENILYEQNIIEAETYFARVRNSFSRRVTEDLFKIEFPTFFEMLTGFRLDQISFP